MSTRKVSGKTWVANWKWVKENRVATHGHCPVCGRLYEIKGNGTLRRHSTTPDCYLKPQFPAEIVPAILLLSELE